MGHAYDFYKPNLDSPYPVVDGQLSVQCFTSALDTCYTQYCTKSQMNHESHSHHSHAHASTLTSREVNLSTFAAVLFHTPYVKLAQKSLARLYLNDLIRACPYISSAITDKYK
jgi:hydroxymethylglutaryl-CoA synthase